MESGAKHHLPDYTPLGHRTCSFISHLNSLESTQPGCHFRLTELFKHTSLYCSSRYQLTPWSRGCRCGQSALPKMPQRLSIIQPSRRSNPQSLACKSHTLPLSYNVPHVHDVPRAPAPHVHGGRPVGHYQRCLVSQWYVYIIKRAAKYQPPSRSTTAWYNLHSRA